MENFDIAESVLELIDIYFENTTYHFQPFEKGELSFNFHRSISELDDCYRVSLQCNIFNADNSIELHDEIIGVFKCECENRQLKEQLIEKNTIAIMFPYLRSHITFVTSQPKRTPINLPPVNINQMFEDAKHSK